VHRDEIAAKDRGSSHCQKLRQVDLGFVGQSDDTGVGSGLLVLSKGAYLEGFPPSLTWGRGEALVCAEPLPAPGARYQVIVQGYYRGSGDPREHLPVLGADRVGEGWRFRRSSFVVH
jgi:hypothetical protein